MIYLALLPGNISFVFDFNIYLFPNILRIIRSPGIGSSEVVIRQFRSADQLDQRDSRCDFRTSTGQKKTIDFFRWSDVDRFYPLDFHLNIFLFFPQFFHLLFGNETRLVPILPYSSIRIILTEQKPVLSAACHHTVGFKVFFRHKIVDENADIRFRPHEDKSFLPFQIISGINSRHNSLGCGFLITGASVELSAGEKSCNFSEFKSASKLLRSQTVVLDRVGIPHNVRIFKTGNRPIHRELNILGHGTRHSVDIHFTRISAFRLNKDLMSVLIRKLHDFILNGRAVARPFGFYHTSIKRRTVDIFADHPVRLFIGVSEPAGDLLDLYRIRIRGKGEWNDSLITLLLGHLRKVDASPINSGGCTRLETDQFDSILSK